MYGCLYASITTICRLVGLVPNMNIIIACMHITHVITIVLLIATIVVTNIFTHLDTNTIHVVVCCRVSVTIAFCVKPPVAILAQL